MTKDELIKKLFKEYDLQYDKNNPESRDNDVYIHKHYKTITRPGLDKIEKKAEIRIEFDPVHGTCGPDWCIIRATGHRTIDGKEVCYTTFASATAGTCKTGYYAEMAEKRVRSRIILKLTGLYELGIYGRDEISKGEDDEIAAPQPKVEKKTLFSDNV